MSGTTFNDKYTVAMVNPSAPIADAETLAPSNELFRLLTHMWVRTGSAAGVSSVDVATQASAAQTTATTAQGAAASAQTTATAAQASATSAHTAVTAETAARIAADALLLPRTGGTLSGPLTAPEYLTAVYTVGTLPGGVAGARAYVSDALAPAFGAAVAGAGTVGVPVYHDGASWKVG